MLHGVALLGRDVSEDPITPIIRLTRLCELGIPSEAQWEAILLVLRSVLRLLVTANVIPSSAILVSLMMEAICSSEASVHSTAIRRNISLDGILHSHRRDNLSSNMFPFFVFQKFTNAKMFT
jgi:hypothetical protein